MWIQLESPLFVPSLGAGFNQDNLSTSLVNAIQHPICTRNGTFAQSVLFCPDLLAGFKVLTDPPQTVGITIQMVTNKNHTAVMILHDLVFINFFSFTTIELDQSASNSISTGHVDLTVPEDGCWHNSRSSWPWVSP